MTEFKIHVERIVRPICGSQSRKNKMREELMGHLLTAHAEAVKLGIDDPVGYATERLGDADTLRNELQASIPRWERLGSSKLSLWVIDYLELPTDVNRTDTLKISIQYTLTMMVAMAFFISPVVLLCGSEKLLEAGTIQWSNLPRVIGMPVSILSCAGLAIFVSIYTFRKLGFSRAVHASSDTPSIIKVGIGAAWCLMFITLFFAQLSELEKHLEFIRGVPIVELFAVLGREPAIYVVGIVGMIVGVLALSEERKQYLGWGCLEIDD